MPEGDVISQNPTAGAKLARGSTVTITVSTGKPQVSVPDVVGMKEAKANSALSRRRAHAGTSGARGHRSRPRTAW